MSHVSIPANIDLVWPLLDMPEELRHMESDAEPAGAPNKVATQPVLPTTTEQYWSVFATQLDDFAVAKTIVDFLDAHPEDLKLHQGMYLQACITLKRGAIAFNEAKAATELAQRQAETSDKALKQQLERMRDPHYLLEVAVKKLGSFLAKPQILGFGLALAIVWIIKH